MPGILIFHSHHNPKTQGELQDMGMTWARSGCLVLVMDHLGHGERRQHPFRTEADYPHPFRVGRQDYFFRHNTGVQLQLVGESLMGWMVRDLMRGLDLLLSRTGIDEDRGILWVWLPVGATRRPSRPPSTRGSRRSSRSTSAGRSPITPSPTTPPGISTGSASPPGSLPGACGWGAGRVRPVADRRVRRPPAADLRPRVRLGPRARPGVAAASYRIAWNTNH